MDERLQRAIGKQIAETRQARGLSQATLAQESGVAPNTVGSIEAGHNVRPGSLAKVQAFLGIEPEVETMWRAGLAPDVHLLVEAVAIWFNDLPEAERPAEMVRLWRYLAAPPAG